tara:strand:+ start:265 stop:690 length:426 start_codon:yes stop_codon:yes gene_type:complete
MVVANVWHTFGTTKQTWLKSCSEYMAFMKMGVGSRPGASIVKQNKLTSTKCDIFATPTNPYYSGDLTPQVKKFFLSRKRGGNGKFLTKCMNLLDNQSTTTIFYAVDGGRVGQFLAVFVHLACEAIFCFYFLRGRPKSSLIV